MLAPLQLWIQPDPQHSNGCGGSLGEISQLQLSLHVELLGPSGQMNQVIPLHILPEAKLVAVGILEIAEQS